MIRKLVLTTGLFAAVALASSAQPASATLVGPHTQIPSAADSMSPFEQVQYRGCRRVARICAYRWGWGSRQFRRCMWRRGC